MADYVNTPFAAFVNYIDSERQRERQTADADLDKKIALIHDLITGPGANPARTAEGIRGILELQGAKGGRGKRKGGLSGFMGAQEDVMPEFLAQLIHGDVPYEGPTYTQEKQTVQEPGFERNALSPLAPGTMPIQPTPPQFDGKSVLQSPVMIPPPPIETPPTGSPMLNAARQMQHEETIKTPLPMAQQPYRLTPDEQAEQAGRAAGVMSREKQHGEDVGEMQAWIEAGGTPEEYRQAKLAKMRGAAGTQLQTQEAGYFKIGDKVVHGIRTINPRTGMWDTVEELSGLPIPPDAVPVAAPSSATHEGTPDQQSLDAFLAAEEARVGHKLSPVERSAAMEKWQTMDANRKRPTTHITIGDTGMTQQDRTAFNQIANRYQTSPLIKAKDRLVTLQENIRQVVQNPKSGGAQLALGYSFVQALDTYQSAVREGELRNLSEIDSSFGRLRLIGERMTNHEIMRPEIAIEIAQAAKALSDAIVKGAAAKEQQFRSQATVNGLGRQWDQYVGGFSGGGALPAPPGAAGAAGAPAQLSPQAQAILDSLRKR